MNVFTIGTKSEIGNEMAFRLLQERDHLFSTILNVFLWRSNFNAGASVVADASPYVVATERFVFATIIIMIFMLLKDHTSIIAL